MAEEIYPEDVSAEDITSKLDTFEDDGVVDNGVAGGTNETKAIDDLVRLVVVALVDEPDLVQVSSHEEGSSLVIDVKVAPDDAGKVIGRQGRIIKSLRTLARAASSYAGGKHIEVELID